MTHLVLIAVLSLQQHPPSAIPHGDHNPKHGGIFFMAPDVFHHLEGVIEGNEFRLYIYNNFTEALDARRFQARTATHPMTSEPGGGWLAAPFQAPPGDEFPEVTVFVKFSPDGPEERFDFIFVPPPPPDVLPDFVIPDTAEDIYRELVIRDTRIQTLMGRGAWTELFNPALEAKDLALALDERVRENPAVTLALKKVVRAGWQLDTYGDLGNREQVEAAYKLFAQGLAELKRVYAP